MTATRRDDEVLENMDRGKENPLGAVVVILGLVSTPCSLWEVGKSPNKPSPSPLSSQLFHLRRHCQQRKRMPFEEDSSACGHEEFPRQCLLLRITATCYADWISKDDTGPCFSQGSAVTGIIRQFWKSFMWWVKHQARWWIVFVQSPSRVRRFATPWTAAHQVSLSFTIS